MYNASLSTMLIQSIDNDKYHNYQTPSLKKKLHVIFEQNPIAKSKAMWNVKMFYGALLQ